MPAYVIATVTVTNPEQYAAYRTLSTEAIAAHGGQIRVRGGEMAVMEGDWPGERVVVIEFPDLAAAKTFYASPEYSRARQARDGAAVMRLICVQGV